MVIKKGLIGHMFKDRPRNRLEKIWWNIKSLFGWKNTTGIPIIVSEKVEPDTTSRVYTRRYNVDDVNDELGRTEEHDTTEEENIVDTKQLNERTWISKKRKYNNRYKEHLKNLDKRNLDKNGYYRNGYGRLVHRDVAYKYIYNRSTYPERFSFYQVHHKDRNKINNHPSNLELLDKQEHKQKHGEHRNNGIKT